MHQLLIFVMVKTVNCMYWPPFVLFFLHQHICISGLFSVYNYTISLHPMFADNNKYLDAVISWGSPAPCALDAFLHIIGVQHELLLNCSHVFTSTKQAALHKCASHLSEMRNRSCYDWFCACACTCVCTADNVEIISTLSFLSFSVSFPRSLAPSCPLPAILDWFSYYFAFVSEHLFLAPLPSAFFFPLRKDKKKERIKHSECVCEWQKNRSFLRCCYYLRCVACSDS